ncbi:MAG: TM2 domain-containing protein [Asgard group archaeon]|nr:TM2 domain-containing protein [Asgard group archaeon]
MSMSNQQRISPKSRLIALLLCLFLGYLGVHRFYVNKICSGIFYLLTGGIFGFGVLIDLILILSGSFRDDRGWPILEWDEAPARHASAPAPAAARAQYQQPPRPAAPPQPPQPSPPPKASGKPVKAKYCETCGSANELESTYCSSCGAVME